MNDDLSGQLTQAWVIPPYAQDQLWVDSESSSAQCAGAHGLFELDAPTAILTVRWGSNDGAALTQLRWRIDNLQWDGSVRLGGMVEAIHLTELPDTDLPMAVIAFSGQPLHPQTRPYYDASQRAITHFDAPDYLSGVDDSHMPRVVTLITLAESPLVSTAQESLMNQVPLHVYGRLADEADGWHRFFALPIVWESVTIFAP